MTVWSAECSAKPAHISVARSRQGTKINRTECGGVVFFTLMVQSPQKQAQPRSGIDKWAHVTEVPRVLEGTTRNHYFLFYTTVLTSIGNTSLNNILGNLLGKPVLFNAENISLRRVLTQLAIATLGLRETTSFSTSECVSSSWRIALWVISRDCTKKTWIQLKKMLKNLWKISLVLF